MHQIRRPLSFSALFILAWLAAVAAHDPGFHVAGTHAASWCQQDEGKTQIKRALVAMGPALVDHGRKANVQTLITPGTTELINLVKTDHVQDFTHILRAWTKGEAKPSARQHLTRCHVCNHLANQLLRSAKQPELQLAVAKERDKLTLAKALTLLKSMNHHVVFQMTAESCDIDGDGYLDGVRLDNDGDDRFDTYQLDLDHDGLVDVIVEWNGKAWIKRK